MSDTDRIATNLRTLLILESLSRSTEPMTPTEINRSLGLPKQSIHRLCQTLADEGFLIRDVSGKRLSPAPRALKMARGLLATQQQTIARRQILLRISEAAGETVNFVLPETDGMTYVDRVETDWIFRIELPIGSRVPFHCTASGKCYLASLDDRTLTKIISTMQFEQRTPNTLTDVAALKNEIATIRRQGYAIDNEELFEGMVALAVPVNDPEGRFMAAIAFHGPTQRLNLETIRDHLDLMRNSAAELAALSA